MGAGRPRRRRLLGVTIAASAVVLALAGAPLTGFGADHLDAPNLSPPEARPDADINDVYVFEGRRDSRTVLVMTTHPAAGAIAPLAYATDVAYKLKVDRNGDARQDIVYRLRFGEMTEDGQPYTVKERRGGGAERIARGMTGRTVKLDGGGKVFAGLRSDPFFFDLDAFLGAVLGVPNGRTFCDQGGGGEGIDFFGSLNVNAIVLEVPDGRLGTQIGVWATTSTGPGRAERIDRMGRPAINTVFNSGDDKIAFNKGNPAQDRARFSGNVMSVLKTFSSLDAEGPYTKAQRMTLAQVLLPDVVTYDTSTPAAGPLNGRALADDVIDAELNIVTGGFPFPGRDAEGAITSDCVGPHDDYRSSFPYLGEPH
jgi:hypothetical protein